MNPRPKRPKLRKNLFRSEWDDLKDALEWFNVLVVQSASRRQFSDPISTYGDPPDSVSALKLVKNRDLRNSEHLTLKLVMLESYDDEESYIHSPPSMELAADILHEAAHLILEDTDSSEEKGIVQLELILARFASEGLWNYVIEKHISNYSWDDSYENTRASKGWKTGENKAKQVVLLWMAVRDDRVDKALELPSWAVKRKPRKLAWAANFI